MSAIRSVFTLTLLLALPAVPAWGALPIIEKVEWQPLTAQIKRLIEATEHLGVPLSEQTRQKLDETLAGGASDAAVRTLQELLDPYCLFGVQINPEIRVKVAQGSAKPELDENGWRQFLIKVQNEAGTTARLQVSSPNAGRLHGSQAADINDRWLDLMLFNRQPFSTNLSGLNLEYRIVQLYSRDAGKREAKLLVDVGQGTQDLGFRSELNLLFDCLPARDIALHVLDEHGQPTTAAFVIRDEQGRVYPSQAKRLAPDFAFHPQIYRGDGEVLRLPSGTYHVEFSRGPESIASQRTLIVRGPSQTETFQVERWIDPAAMGWWSGDHHIHAAGCAHYDKPTEGVLAKDMIRHVVGEDLKVGANLTWGPCFDYQKQFFCGVVDQVSRYPYLLRYDVEVSGFGSHQSGHLCLLRLKEQIYPGGESKEHWPTLCLNTLRWAKRQGAVTGPAHSGWGLKVSTSDLPNYIVPPYDAIGANEYVVDVTHHLPGPDGKPMPAVDFLSMVDTPYVWELNMWYQTLNVGYRTRISGETDFPCIYGERVGLGRSYIKLEGELDYDRWCEGIREGRCYVSDGKSHLINFTVNDLPLGEKGSELSLARPGAVHLKVKAAARLEPKPNRHLQNRRYDEKPYWDVERARIGETREVLIEVIVNGYPVAKQKLVADGELRDMEFDVPIEFSSWIAVRILPSSHTNPVFILVDGKPIRASRRSAEWCLKGVDQCWSQKERFIKPDEMDTAEKAYAHARETYTKLVEECRAD